VIFANSILQFLRKKLILGRNSICGGHILAVILQRNLINKEKYKKNTAAQV